MGPVQTFAGEELDAGAVFAGLDAVAVEFEFVQPAFVGGRGFGLLRELRSDEFGLRLFGEFRELLR